MEYLNAALEDPDPAIFQAALGDVAKSRGMTAIAEGAGVGRESLYKSLSQDGNPSCKTVTRIIDALGLQLEIKIPA
ncbi:MAG: putative addiction module antidote protein [Actinobaculum massiliense]|nr:addiction module antidote protein [Actinobaculum massiliense]MDK8319407.1 putative addiction module antidote protein [Actinobaculum massiliense]MDK8567873.1 putative addiction module antidote protein [Actinobaculum massiliense]